MIDPFTAIAAATTAFNTVKKFVHAGQEFENCMGQMGKWYTSVSDFRKGQAMQKNPPIFKKLLAAGSIEEEALNLLIHEKKIMEMELELQQMLNMRFGFGTWDELKEMQRKIRADRQKQVYAAAEAQQAVINGVAIIALLFAGCAMLFGIVYFIAKAKGMIQLVYVYENFKYVNQDNKGILYKDERILFIGNSWSGILQFLALSGNAPEVREMFKSQLEQREKPKFQSNLENEK